MAQTTSAPPSSYDLDSATAERDARAGERERVALEISALADFVRSANDELTRATERLAREVAERAEAIRGLASAAQRHSAGEGGAVATAWSGQLGQVGARSVSCSDALHAWVKAEEKVSKAIVRLRELKGRQGEHLA